MMNASVHDMGHLRWKAARWKPTGHEGCCRSVSALEASGAYKSGWGGGRRDSPFESQAQAAKSGIENTIRPLVVPDLHQHARIAVEKGHNLTSHPAHDVSAARLGDAPQPIEGGCCALGIN